MNNKSFKFIVENVEFSHNIANAHLLEVHYEIFQFNIEFSTSDPLCLQLCNVQAHVKRVNIQFFSGSNTASYVELNLP